MGFQLKLWLKYLLYYFISCILMPILIVPILALYIYRKLIFSIIYKKHNPLDITILNSEDIIWTVGEVHHNTSDIILRINLKSGNIDDFVEKMKECVIKAFLNDAEKYPKLTSILCKFMGYSYLLRTNVNINDCVRKVKVKGDKALSEIMSHYANRKLPLNNQFLWEIIIFDGCNDWKKREKLNENQVPILVRINHCVGDGVNIMNLTIHMFDHNGVNINSVLKKFSNKEQKGKQYNFKKILRSIHVLMLSAGYMFEQHLKNKNDVWDGPKVFYKRHLTYAVENYDDNILESIKSIKQEMGDTRFTEVILTAISASIEKFFQKESLEVPQYVLMAVVIVETLLELNTAAGDPSPKNLVSFDYLKVPIAIQTGYVRKRLQSIQEQTRKMRKVPGSSIHYLIVRRIVGLIPENLLKAAISTKRLTTSLSNLPGIDKIYLWDENEIENIFFFAPVRDCVGMGFTIMTYNKQLHIGFNFDEATISCHEDGQKIVNDILNNLLLMKKQLLNEK